MDCSLPFAFQVIWLAASEESGRSRGISAHTSVKSSQYIHIHPCFISEGHCQSPDDSVRLQVRRCLRSRRQESSSWPFEKASKQKAKPTNNELGRMHLYIYISLKKKQWKLGRRSPMPRACYASEQYVDARYCAHSARLTSANSPPSCRTRAEFARGASFATLIPSFSPSSLPCL